MSDNLQSELWVLCNLLSSESVNDTSRELQLSILLLTKAFARRTNILRSKKRQALRGSLMYTLLDFVTCVTFLEINLSQTPRQDF